LNLWIIILIDIGLTRMTNSIVMILHHLLDLFNSTHHVTHWLNHHRHHQHQHRFQPNFPQLHIPLHFIRF
jgi:hypothetical protein